jgi:hypothetical protein
LAANPDEASAAFSDAGEGEAPTESFHGGKRSAKHRTAPEDLPQPGDRFGSYQLARVLGRGGMGMVYEAEDTATSRRVALKLLTHGWDSPEARNRFFREGRLAASINHPHSVYIYGTEEIDGTPAISMEHIAGGTLQERVREDGPLSPTEAVDAILDIIAGLEAAAAVGVLHRDVKPSNCFIDVEGTVKIGDFGLSMSTTSHSDSYLTIPGAYLGTPAFSSPEQLRGDVLDVRSDIYAVGVTLFYLLTGRTPFEGENLVKLLATVLEQPAPSPAEFRERLPNGLCKVVLRCLAKQPGDRYRDYNQLRAALVPYDSTAPTAATLALRFAAGACDHFIISMISTAIFATMWGAFMLTPEGVQLFGIPIVVSLNLIYFAVPEAFWGASPGKALMGLRVVVGQQGRLGLRRALARTLIYVGAPGVLGWTYWAVNGAAAATPETTAAKIGISLLAATNWVIQAALFSTARRRNGFAAVHDLATGARVVLAEARLERPSLKVEPIALPDKVTRNKVGPFHILDTLRKTPGDELLLGYDSRLLRRVWIHRIKPDTKPVSNHRRSVGRVGRLRWISGKRSETEAWDAYDSFSGMSFLEVAQQPQQWEAVRVWLLDLATELTAAGKDQTLPTELRLEHIWITADGRAKLLDFAAPRSDGGVKPLHKEFAWEQPSYACLFLTRVALLALNGCSQTDGASELRDVALQIPLSASETLACFEESVLSDIVGKLDGLSSSAARITRRRRSGVYAAMTISPLLAASLYVFALFSTRALADIRPELNDLRIAMFGRQITLQDRNLSKEELERNEAAWEIYIANRFRSTIEDEKAWNELLAQTVDPRSRQFAERAVQRHPSPTADEIEAAEALIEPLIAPAREVLQNFATEWLRPHKLAAMALLVFTFVWIFFVSIPTLAAALVTRRGVIARAFGIDYVSSQGTRASKYRLLWRALLTQSVVTVLCVLTIFVIGRGGGIVWPPIVVSAISALLFVLPFKARSVADRLAGTYPVAA